MSKKLKTGLWIAGGIIFLMALSNTYNSGSSDRGKSNSETTQSYSAKASSYDTDSYSTINAIELYGQYKSNEIAAGNQYKGTTMNITGTIGKFDKNILADNPEIRFDSGNYLDAVICEFSQSDADVLASLSKGQQVTINGTIDDYEFCILTVKHCKLVSK